MLCVWGACVYLLFGCGSSDAVDFFGASGGSGSTSMNLGSSAPCSPAKDLTGGSSGPFGSTGAECFRIDGNIAGWGCSNFDGRSVKVNGQTVTCGQVPLPDAVDGAYYFDVSGGTFDYASFYWY